jgi:hypothetical protein
LGPPAQVNGSPWQNEFGAGTFAIPEGSAPYMLGISVLGLAFVAFRMSKSSRPVLHS